MSLMCYINWSKLSYFLVFNICLTISAHCTEVVCGVIYSNNDVFCVTVESAEEIDSSSAEIRRHKAQAFINVG